MSRHNKLVKHSLNHSSLKTTCAQTRDNSVLRCFDSRPHIKIPKDESNTEQPPSSHNNEEMSVVAKILLKKEKRRATPMMQRMRLLSPRSPSKAVKVSKDDLKFSLTQKISSSTKQVYQDRVKVNRVTSAVKFQTARLFATKMN